jgi:tetratricopeptide (TPR) repeat protein
MTDGQTLLAADDYQELATSLELKLERCDDPTEADELRLRLARLYLGALPDAARAVAHVEELLRRDDVGDEALQVTTALLEHELVAPRAAALLSATYGRLGRVDSEAVALATELTLAPSPRNDSARRRLAELRYRELGDPAGAMDLVEPLVVADPGDDELRHLYVDIAQSLGSQLRAAETLTRALKKTKAVDVRERVGFDAATLYLQEGELKQARNAFLDVVLVEGGGSRAIAASQRLLDLESEPGDPLVIGAALEAIAKGAADAASRQDAAVRLLSLHEHKPLKESRLAIAHQALVDSARAEEALAWLAAFHEKHGDKAALVNVYRRQALRAGDPEAARALALRSLELCADESDAARAEHWLWFVANYGPDRRAHAELIVLLEQAHRHADLCRVLEAEVELAPADERAPIWSRLGRTRLVALGDTEGALVALGRCLSLDPSNEVALSTIESMMAAGPGRLAAADILEPIYRHARDHEGELRVLETRAELVSDPDTSVAAYARAVDVASGELHDPRRAVQLCRRGLTVDPSAPELLHRLDALIGDEEMPVDRLARYEAALAGTTAPERRSVLMHAIAAIRRDALGDEPGAMDVWRAILAHAPADVAAYDALIETTATLGDADAALDWMEHARAALEGDARDRMTVRKARALAAGGAIESALGLCRELVDAPAVDPSILEEIAEIAGEQGDAALYRRALVHVGLVELYARTGNWARLPDALRIRVETSDDVGSCVLLLLRLEGSAVQAHAVDPFVALADELVGRVGHESPGQIRALRRARARVLASDPARQSACSQALRQLVEQFEDDEDIRDFDSFIESLPEKDTRHEERRWLFRWRAAHSARPASVLFDWAKAEEDHGAPEAAIAVYERLAETEPGRRAALEAVCRLKVHAGDLEGGLQTFRALRDGCRDDDERLAADLRMVGLLAQEHYPVEAAVVLAPTLAVQPPIEQAHDLARRMLADPASRNEVAARIAEMATAADEVTALRIFSFLLANDAGASTRGPDRATGDAAAAGDAEAPMPARRRQWYQRIVDLSRVDPDAALSTIARGVLEFPDAVALWEGLEGIARERGRPDAALLAYRTALVDGVTDPSLAEALGQRMVRFEEQSAIESPHSTEALLKVLALAPGARWALDRVKLVLGSQARYDELFGLLDRAIEAAPDERERGALLSEAAFAARDLAGLPLRAIAYLTALHALRPDDATVDAALERLYERQGRKVELIDLLRKRVDRTTGFKRRDLRRRMASLWLDLGDGVQADAVIERLLQGDAFVADVVDLLERILEHPAPAAVHDRAIARLRGHYEALGKIDDVVRIAERSLALGADADERSRRVRDLVALRLVAGEGRPGLFRSVIAHVEADVAGDPRLAKTAFKALLLRALHALGRARSGGTDAADATDGAYATVLRLKDILLESGSAEATFSLLRRSSRVPFDRGRRRELLRAAALVCAERLRDAPRAIRVFGELFEEDPGDDLAARSLGPFAALLEETGQHANLARLWEEQARIRAKTGNAVEEQACWERAAALWERQQAWERAMAAYRRGAALGSETAFEALARIHAERREWADAAKALEWLFAHAPASTRAAHALRLADAYVAMDRRDRARACLEETLQATVDGPGGASPKRGADPGADRAEQVRERLIALYRQDQVWPPLARLLAAEARRVDDAARQLALLREAAGLYRSELGEPDEAAALLALAVALEPNDTTLRATLVEVLETSQRWDEAAAVLRGQIRLYGDQRSRERAVVHRRLAHALVQANQLEDAFAELRLAVEMYPAHPESLFDLARVAFTLDKLDLSERTYRALLLVVHGRGEDGAATGGPSRVEVFLDLSEIALRRGDTSRAADLVDSAFDEALERGEDPAGFERGLRARGRHDLVARALEHRVERGATLADRAVALGDLADLWVAHLGRSADLEVRIRQQAERIARDLGHEEELTDSSSWAALATAYARLDEGRPRPAELVTLLETAIPKVKPGADRSRLRVMLAKVLLERTADSERAIAVLSGALADDPAGREATELLSSLLEAQGRTDDLVTVLEGRLLSLPSDSDARDFIDAAMRLARALEGAGRARDAVPVYESVVDRGPTDPETFRTLAERLENLGSDRVADCLERWIVLDAGAGDAVARRLVELRDSRGDTAGAVRALEIAAPRDRSLLLRLVDSYRAAGEDREALRVLDAAVAAHPADVELLSLRAAVREHLGDGAGAVSDLEAATTADSRQVNALLELLGRIANTGESAGADAHTMRLVDTLIRLNRPKQARRELERLLSRTPQHVDALGKLASLAAAEGSWEMAANAYLQLLLIVEKGTNREKLARVAVATADACERAGRLEESREVLDRAIDALAPGPGMVLELERLCRAMKDWARLAKLLVARAEAEDDAHEKAELLLRAGRVMLKECGDPAGALVVLDLCRAIAPESMEALLLWARAQVALGRTRQALGALYETAERNRGRRSPLLASVYLEIGKAHLAADELVEAFEALDFGFAVDWRTGDIAMLLGLVARDLDEEKVAVRAFSAVTTLPPRKDPSAPGADPATKAVAFYHLASIACEQGDLAKARRLATKAVSGDPAHGAARALFEKLNAQAAPEAHSK